MSETNQDMYKTCVDDEEYNNLMIVWWFLIKMGKSIKLKINEEKMFLLILACLIYRDNL